MSNRSLGASAYGHSSDSGSAPPSPWSEASLGIHVTNKVQIESTVKIGGGITSDLTTNTSINQSVASPQKAAGKKRTISSFQMSTQAHHHGPRTGSLTIHEFFSQASSSMVEGPGKTSSIDPEEAGKGCKKARRS